MATFAIPTEATAATPAPPKPTELTYTSTDQVFVLFLLGIVLVGGAFALSIVFAGNTPATPEADVALLLIAGAALVIERIMELGWTAVDLTAGKAWPFKQLSNGLKTHLAQANDILKPYFDAVATLAAVKEEDKDKIEAEIKSALEQVTAVVNVLNQNKTKLTDDQKMDMLLATASEKLETLRVKFPQAATTAFASMDLAADMTKTMTGVFDSLKDNPLRRIISIYVGVIFGICVSSVLQLDIFSATASGIDLDEVAIPLTGLMIGLGSSPTHEAIRALQEFKESKKLSV